MSSRILFTAVGGALALAIAMVTLAHHDEPPTAVQPTRVHRDAESREYRILSIDSGLQRAEIEQLMAQSDRVRERIEAEGETDLGAAVRARLGEVEIRADEVEAYYSRYRDLFGHRSLAQARFTIERLIAIDTVRREFALR